MMDAKKSPPGWNEARAALLKKFENEGASNLYDLRGLLIFYGASLPPSVFDALINLIDRQMPQEPTRDVARWLAVLDARRLGLSWRSAYDEASFRLEGTPAEGEPRTMKYSYQKIEKQRRLKSSKK